MSPNVKIALILAVTVLFLAGAIGMVLAVFLRPQ